MEMGVRGWNDLGIVGTIHEEEEDSLSSSSSTLPSLHFSPSHTPSKLGRSNDPDVVVIHVQESCFRLHKAVLISKSAYLRRKLSDFPEITLSPPLNITAQTFSTVTEFCYGAHVAISPTNVAALRTAAELLGMTEPAGPGDRSLKEITEEYFIREVAGDEENLSAVLTSCFSLLPEAETAATLVSRCFEALSLTAGGGGDLSFLEGVVKGLGMEDFHMILESISQRLTDCHDLIYTVIDIYLKANVETLTEDRKIQICNHIDCTILSPKLLMHAVQNPKMPLRFVVQAMFLQQLTTRHTIISAAASSHHHHHKEQKDAVTLGAILQRDAALRQVSHLRAAMAATSSRIKSLERELSGMRKVLSVSGVEFGPGRASSFRLSSDGGGRVERGQRGSVSALSVRRNAVNSPDGSSSEGWRPRMERRLGRRLVEGLKGAFGLGRKKRDNKGAEDGNHHHGDGNVVIIKKDGSCHRRPDPSCNLET